MHVVAAAEIDGPALWPAVAASAVPAELLKMTNRRELRAMALRGPLLRVGWARRWPWWRSAGRLLQLSVVGVAAVLLHPCAVVAVGGGAASTDQRFRDRQTGRQREKKREREREGKRANVAGSRQQQENNFRSIKIYDVKNKSSVFVSV